MNTFKSARQINEAINSVAYGRGYYGGVEPRVEKDGLALPIVRAKVSKGEFMVRLKYNGEWHKCQLKDVFLQ